MVYDYGNINKKHTSKPSNNSALNYGVTTYIILQRAMIVITLIVYMKIILIPK